MSRLPIRIRLTLAFAGVMAVVLVALGAFLYVRLGSSLDEAVDEGLQAHAADMRPRVSRGEAVEFPGESDEGFVQVVDADGVVIDGSPRPEPLLDAPALARARERDAVTTVLGSVRGLDGRVRVLAIALDTSRGPVVLSLGSSLEDRDGTVRDFLTLLLVVGPAALIVVSLLGYGLASAALRPVEAMRVEADGISGSEPGRRLPLAEAPDEVRRLGETLNAMLERLETALGRERAFVADAGHELRMPLARLKTELELALRRPRTHEELEEAVRSAAAETDRLARLAEDLLLLARSDQAQIPLRRRRVPAESILRAVEERFAPRAREAGRILEVSAPATADVDADFERVEQALGNLVENALNHGDGTIRLSAETHDGLVELHVRDEGPGFPGEFLDLAFDRFTQADTARSVAGTGLGLPIAQAIAGAHGGSAQAVNRSGSGADVWLSLPAA